MEGNFKKIVLIFICLMLMCCKDKDYEEHLRLLNEARLFQRHLIKEGHQLIRQNSSILIDSVSVFDIKSLNPNEKKEKLTVGLIDSVYYKNTGIGSGNNFISFKIHKADLSNFESDYELKLVERFDENTNENLLFITFSNFRIENKKARIIVKKVKGIGMMKATFFFEKINNVWVFKKKQVHGEIG
ncbi:hypothetical protein SAMN05192550_0766 [Flavobacterium glycines]|uniref:Uncharacterized protein n=1 Tax=Flavobacterium glycines TaxID=551990 RepID=A0A1B9DTP0_9FLAO|nr:hypothetical protein [Flavobacterium glycines]OCB73062.1 hypothetical protein FBGL_04105 [Flavobacterium glycines]GEL10208.1 hypothetical protein FGL01_09470 [Flavobacterium glycines]SDI76983.1 hypothetical protein SAMN05192550_0766 [Flavobacterium glycines]